MSNYFHLFPVFLFLVLGFVTPQETAAPSQIISVAVLDLGDSEIGRVAGDRVAAILNQSARTGSANVVVLDRDLSRLAARGLGYGGSLNLAREEARDLGAAIGCRFFITGHAATLKRTSSSSPLYFESYRSVFIVSERTGKLVLWDRPAAEALTADEAETAVARELESRTRDRYLPAIVRAMAQEGLESRYVSTDQSRSVIDLSADEQIETSKQRLREPVPYRRLKPVYPDTAERAEAEATVDAAVDIAADGAVTKVEIVRWAGFGLDDAVVATVRQMHFRPATQEDGVAVPVRVLLRYNFRRPPRGKS